MKWRFVITNWRTGCSLWILTFKHPLLRCVNCLFLLTSFAKFSLASNCLFILATTRIWSRQTPHERVLQQKKWFIHCARIVLILDAWLWLGQEEEMRSGASTIINNGNDEENVAQCGPPLEWTHLVVVISAHLSTELSFEGTNYWWLLFLNKSKRVCKWSTGLLISLTMNPLPWQT